MIMIISQPQPVLGFFSLSSFIPIGTVPSSQAHARPHRTFLNSGMPLAVVSSVPAAIDLRNNVECLRDTPGTENTDSSLVLAFFILGCLFSTEGGERRESHVAVVDRKPAKPAFVSRRWALGGSAGGRVP